MNKQARAVSPVRIAPLRKIKKRTINAQKAITLAILLFVPVFLYCQRTDKTPNEREKRISLMSSNLVNA
jgi:hypothetical protein